MIKLFRKPKKSVVSVDEKKNDVNEKSTKKISKKEIRIESVMAKTGWSREETINTIEALKERYGITYG